MPRNCCQRSNNWHPDLAPPYPLPGVGIDNDERPIRMVLLAADSAGIADVVRSIRDISSLPSIFLLASREARLTRHLPALAMAGLDQLFEMGDHDRLDQLEEVYAAMRAQFGRFVDITRLCRRPGS